MSEENNADLPLRKTMCDTCPFRAGSPYAYLQATLAQSASTEASRICHNTGESNGIHPDGTGIAPHLCRGARKIQLQLFCDMGFIDKPTDKAWNEMRVVLGFKPTVIKDP